MQLYYEEDSIKIYHADCRDVLPSICADVLITDPPYGINVGNNQSARDKRSNVLVKQAYESYNDTPANYQAIVLPALKSALTSVKRAAIFGFPPNVWLLPSPDCLGGIFVPAGCGRSQWGFTSFMPILLYGVAPNLQDGARPTAIRSTTTAEKNGHPTPKPIEWLRWLVNLTSEISDMIIDPFVGSGTTLLAAKQLGRKAIGIEISEAYCEIAAERLRQSVLNFEPEPIQATTQLPLDAPTLT